MGFDETVGEDDTIYLEKGVRMVIDEMSLPYLVGVVINFTEDLMGSSFEISNPNAQSSCGCGNSFSA